MSPKNPRILFLTGAPASGKTTLARRLAAQLKIANFDLDDEIVAEEKRTIREIFATDGEAFFRACESRILRALVAKILANRENFAIVSLGGGTLLDPKSRKFVEANGLVLCLDTPNARERAQRFAHQPLTRPLGDVSLARREHYASFSRRVTTSFLLHDSLILVGSSIAKIFAKILAKNHFVVADQKIAKIYHREKNRENLKIDALLPSGEKYKTLATIQKLWKKFAMAGLSRHDCVLSIGGGVTSDLVGFAAATWMRGIDWMNFPTTLLAMVDASVGGKTGFDLPEGKNLIGAFHPPKLVVIDSDFLSTLPKKRLIEGWAEIFKHKLISGDATALDATRAPTAAEIARALAVKVALVQEDPFERSGRRILLNCGHTIAHAIEKKSNYAISHGAAVAIGCVMEARLAAKLKLAPREWPDELAKFCRDAGLPFACDFDFRELIPIMLNDKKKFAKSVITFALPCAWGDVRAVKVDLAKIKFAKGEFSR